MTTLSKYCCTLVVLGVTLPSCAVLGLSAGERSDYCLTVSAANAAWALAAVVAAEFPGSDPDPYHGGRLLLHQGVGQFELRIGRGTGEPYRIASNARILPPETIAESTGPHLTTARCVDLPRTTRINGQRHGVDALVVATPTGCRIEVHIYGETRRGAFRWHLETALAGLEAATANAAAAAGGHWQQVEHDTAAALQSISPGCCDDHRRCVAVVHALRAIATCRRGQLVAGRMAMSRAVDSDPRAPALRLLLAQLDDRLARDNDADQSWLRLTLHSALGPRRHALLSRMRERLGQRSANTRSDHDLEQARQHQSDGDPEAAQHWARRSYAAPTRSRPIILLGAIHRARGEPDRAFGLGLEQAARGDLDAEAILHLLHDGIAAGRPTTALRHLARRWNELEANAPEVAHTALRTVLRELQPEVAARVLATERGTLPAELLARWRDRGANAGPALFASLEQLRDEIPAPLRIEVEPQRYGFENAPGVAPPR